MQLDLGKSVVKVNETIFEGTPEQGFETDIVLPDYCPDIARILKCNTTAKISQCYQNGNHLDIDGFVFVQVYYLCSENNIHSYSTRLPFSKSITLRETPDMLSARVSTQVQYVNCRAVNRRRLDIRGAVELVCRVSTPRERMIISQSEDQTVQLRRQTLSNTSTVGEICRTFSVKEELPAATRNPITTILRQHAVAMPTEVKVIANKLIVKGEMAVSVISASDDASQIECSNYIVPISQIVDLEGVSEECVCTVDFDVVSLDITPRMAAEGQVLEIDAKLNIYASAKCSEDVTVCDDAYALDGELNSQSEEIQVTALCEHLDTKLSYKHTFTLPEGDTAVVDLWYEPKTLASQWENGNLTITLPVQVSIISQNEAGECHYTEETLPIIERRAVSCQDGATFDGCARVCECGYSVSSQGVEVTLSVRFCGDVLCVRRVNVITDITCSESSNSTRSDAALTIYFSEKGESVWNIAKRYRTLSDSICRENGIEGDTVTGGILLIPSAL